MYTKHVHQACTPSMYTNHVHQACTPSMYTKPIGDIVKRHRFNYHCYADDTYMYFSIKPGENWGDVSVAIGAFVADVGAWMTRNMLQHNRKKSELIVFSSKHQLPSRSEADKLTRYHSWEISLLYWTAG